MSFQCKRCGACCIADIGSLSIYAQDQKHLDKPWWHEIMGKLVTLVKFGDVYFTTPGDDRGTICFTLKVRQSIWENPVLS